MHLKCKDTKKTITNTVLTINTNFKLHSLSSEACPQFPFLSWEATEQMWYVIHSDTQCQKRCLTAHSFPYVRHGHTLSFLPVLSDAITLALKR